MFTLNLLLYSSYVLYAICRRLVLHSWKEKLYVAFHATDYTMASLNLLLYMMIVGNVEETFFT